MLPPASELVCPSPFRRLNTMHNTSYLHAYMAVINRHHLRHCMRPEARAGFNLAVPRTAAVNVRNMRGGGLLLAMLHVQPRPRHPPSSASFPASSRAVGTIELLVRSCVTGQVYFLPVVNRSAPCPFPATDVMRRGRFRYSNESRCYAAPRFCSNAHHTAALRSSSTTSTRPIRHVDALARFDYASRATRGLARYACKSTSRSTNQARDHLKFLAHVYECPPPIDMLTAFI